MRKKRATRVDPLGWGLIPTGAPLPKPTAYGRRSGFARVSHN